MGYKALYRTYRPQKFSEVIGQDIIIKTLQNSIITGKFLMLIYLVGQEEQTKLQLQEFLQRL